MNYTVENSQFSPFEAIPFDFTKDKRGIYVSLIIFQDSWYSRYKIIRIPFCYSKLTNEQKLFKKTSINE